MPKINKKLRNFCLGWIYLVISPIYIPVKLCWEEKKEIKDFYIECYNAIMLNT